MEIQFRLLTLLLFRCNLRCNHCFYKDTLDAPNPGEMNLDIIDNYTKNLDQYYGMF